MAQLAANSPQRGPRMSQVLPTVKCSSCNYSVPLDKLGDHVCALPPPLPSSSDTKPMPRQPTLHTALSPPNAAHRSPRDTRSPPMIPSIIPQDIRRQHSARLRNSPSPAPSRGAPSPAPSRNGVRSPGPLSLMVPPSRTQSPFTPASSARQMIPRHSERVSDLPPDPRDRPRPDAAPSILSGNTQPLTFRATSSNAPIPPALDARSRPSAPLSPLAQGFQGVHDPRPALVHAEPGHHFRSPASPAPSNYSSRSQHFMGPEIDTKSGGVAGMAGVGRRGFAAAARAALFAAPPVSRLPSPAPMSPAPRNPASHSGQGMDGMRVDVPPLAVLNPSIAPPMPYLHHAPPSPISLPFHSSQDPRPSSNTPRSPAPTPSATPRPHERESSADSRPSSIPFPVKLAASNTPGPLTPTSPISPSFSSPEKSSQKKALVPGDNVKVVTQDDVNSSFLGRSTDNESEFGGLAYAEGDESDDDAHIERSMGHTPTRVHHSPSASSTYSDEQLRVEEVSIEDGLNIVMAALLRSPTSTDEALSPMSLSKSIPRASKPPIRSLTSPTQREPSSPGGTIGRRGGTISGAIGGGSSSEKSKTDRLSLESSASGLAKHRVLTCIRCTRDIEDRRWIRVEGGGMLCDKCWKNMYLPKCRRCDLPIEKQAVSSSDGQLKGKYHRDCFNCHTCQKPFPDKTFYVFDGKPFCDYHYHEANNSLCAAPDCGRPIEGPCAVSHAGDRYHPEHLTCDYEDEGSGKRCDERLVDYWEIEGRMLCDRHVRVVEQDLMGVGLDDSGIGTDSRAMKRKTRFIDIAGLR